MITGGASSPGFGRLIKVKGGYRGSYLFGGVGGEEESGVVAGSALLCCCCCFIE